MLKWLLFTAIVFFCFWCYDRENMTSQNSNEGIMKMNEEQNIRMKVEEKICTENTQKQ